MKGLLLILMLLSAGDGGWREAALLLSGAADAESLSADEWERYDALHAHPVPLNLSSRSRLLSTGLFSAYQVASLLDYRARSGDVLSGAELALVDGFDPETASALGFFVSFYSSSLPGSVPDSLGGRVRQELEMRTKGPAGKYRIAFGERAAAGLAWREDMPGFYGVCYGKGHLGKVVAGRYNARFGQGLALWTGFVLEDLLSPASFVRRSAGISPSWSYAGTGTWMGVAADAVAGRWDFAGFVAAEGLGAHAGLSWRSGRVALTAVWPEFGSAPRLSADIRYNPRGIQFFGEVASEPVQGHFAAVGGLVTPIGGHLKGALRLSAVPSAYSHKKYGEYGAESALSWKAGPYVPLRGRTGFGSSEIRWQGAFAGSFALLPVPGGDTSRRLVKLKADTQWRISPALKAGLRVSQRWRNYASERSRTECRLDMGWSDAVWSAAARVHGVWCDGGGLLAYAEAGRSGALVSCMLRATLFRTDGWASRIYAYERDAPGNFSVPAYYGQGWALTMLWGGRKSWKGCTLKTWARLYIVQKKSGSSGPGLSLQASLLI